MLILRTPDMNCATERKTDVRFTANPVCSKRVLNMIPSDSPQETMQKQLKKQTKNNCVVRGKPAARSTRIAKMKEVKISNGISSVRYCTKNAETEYVPSSCSR